MSKLLAGTREVSLGNLEIAIEHRSQDEMKTLVDGFNAMIKDLKSHQQELAELSKKVAWAEMARKVAHEIKNPLTPIQLSAEHILRVYEDKRGDFEKALQESVSYIISEVENLRRIAQEFLETRPGHFDPARSRLTCGTSPRGRSSPTAELLAERIRFRSRSSRARNSGSRRQVQAQDRPPQHLHQRRRGHPGPRRNRVRSAGAETP